MHSLPQAAGPAQFSAAEKDPAVIGQRTFIAEGLLCTNYTLPGVFI